MYKILIGLSLFLILYLCSQETIVPYYETNKYYPELSIFETDEPLLNLIEESQSVVNWIPWPERYLWDKPNARTDDKPNTQTWTVFPFYGYGKWSERNCSLCPKTAAMLKQIPNLRTAGFSKLAPNTVLSQHKGWAKLANHVLRSHLLLTDNNIGSCYLTVNGKNLNHKYGKWVTFDDSLTHYATNNDIQDRIVLLIDIERPKDIPLGFSNIQESSELETFIANR